MLEKFQSTGPRSEILCGTHASLNVVSCGSPNGIISGANVAPIRAPRGASIKLRMLRMCTGAPVWSVPASGTEWNIAPSAKFSGDDAGALRAPQTERLQAEPSRR